MPKHKQHLSLFATLILCKTLIEVAKIVCYVCNIHVMSILNLFLYIHNYFLGITIYDMACCNLLVSAAPLIKNIL